MLLRTPLTKPSATGRALKFAIVGGMGAIVNTASLYVLYRWLSLPLATASALAVELAVVHNYLLNDWWTFSVRAPSIRRFLKFNVSVLGGLVVNVFIVWLLVSVEVYFLLANGLGISAAFTVNFLSSAGWVWGRQNS
jgi:putative flippase GtrA